MSQGFYSLLENNSFVFLDGGVPTGAHVVEDVLNQFVEVATVQVRPLQQQLPIGFFRITDDFHRIRESFFQ